MTHRSWRYLWCVPLLGIAGCGYTPADPAETARPTYRADLAACEKSADQEAHRRVAARGELFLTYPISLPVVEGANPASAWTGRDTAAGEGGDSEALPRAPPGLRPGPARGHRPLDPILLGRFAPTVPRHDWREAPKECRARFALTGAVAQGLSRPSTAFLVGREKDVDTRPSPGMTMEMQESGFIGRLV